MSEESFDKSTVRAVRRALNLISLMNRRVMWRLGELHAETGLPKATLSRLLRTLEAEGYVVSDATAGVYRLTSKIRHLSSGYNENVTMVEMGAPRLIRLTRDIKWPLSIGLPSGTDIVIHFTTMPYSPLASFTTTLGFRRPMMTTAMGQVYLAFCTENEREIISELIVSPNDPGAHAQQRRINSLVRSIGEKGYAVRATSADNETSTLAVPILIQGTAQGALGMTTFGRSMTRRVVEQHVPILQRTADEIGKASQTVDG